MNIILQTIITNSGNTARSLKWAGIYLEAGACQVVDGAYPSACRNRHDQAACEADVLAGLVRLQLVTNLPTQLVNAPLSNEGLSAPASAPSAPKRAFESRQTDPATVSDGAVRRQNTPVGGEGKEKMNTNVPQRSLLSRAYPDQAKQDGNAVGVDGTVAEPSEELQGKLVQEQQPAVGLPPRVAPFADDGSVQQALDHMNNALPMFGEAPSTVVDRHDVAAPQHQAPPPVAQQPQAVPDTPAADPHNVMGHSAGEAAIQRQPGKQPGASQVSSAPRRRATTAKKAPAATNPTTPAAGSPKRRRASK